MSFAAARALLVVLALAAPASAALPAPALALPEGRVYEMVSPAYKGGYGASILATAPDGESVAFTSLGGFADLPWGTGGENDYVARRGAAGWTTSSIEPPPVGGVFDFSSSLDAILASSNLTENVGTRNSDEQEFLLHRTGLPDTAADWEVYGGLVLHRLGTGPWSGGSPYSASGDLCHLVLAHSQGALTPEATHLAGLHAEAVYDLAQGCAGEPPSLQLVGVKNKLGVEGEPEPLSLSCPTILGNDNTGSSPPPGQRALDGAVSADGSEIFFGQQSLAAHCESAREQLYVRVGGARTLELSRPLEAGPFGGCNEGGQPGEVPGEVPCAGAAQREGAYFSGASADGSRVFFVTDAALASGDQDDLTDLYTASIGCPASEQSCAPAQRVVTSLTQASHDPTPGEPAEVQGVLRVAGSRAYFVARGVLDDQPNAEGREPVKGAANLYLYDAATNSTTFVTELCSGPRISGVAGVAEGAVEDLACPSTLDSTVGGRNDTDLWADSGQVVQSTPDGAVLVFASYGRLTRDDVDDTSDVYRYAAESGRLQRVSIGEAGFDANGNDNQFGASIPSGGLGVDGIVSQVYEMASRAVSADGTRIVFSTAAPLSPNAVNGLSNIYEWHASAASPDGVVSLVSSGRSATPDSGAVISSSGRDLFFLTSEGLAPQDTDGQIDVYDARLGGGSPAVPAERQPCSGDACQGALSSPAPLLVPGSVSQAPGNDLPPTVSPPPAAKHPRLTRAQQLARALKACHKVRSPAKRQTCEKRARHTYGSSK